MWLKKFKEGLWEKVLEGKWQRGRLRRIYIYIYVHEHEFTLGKKKYIIIQYTSNYHHAMVYIYI